jgi:uncharacterized peroxidase-related enzyme
VLFNSLTETGGVREALCLNEEAGRLLTAYHQQLLRGDSPLTVAERELIAAYVSGLNHCRYCYETHRETAENFGVEDGLIAALVADPEVRDAPQALRPLLRYARKLTLDHSSLEPEDAEAVRAAGWSERALHDLILVAAMFNFMNRFVHGHGIHAGPQQWQASGRFLFERGYSAVVDAGLAARAAGVGIE